MILFLLQNEVSLNQDFATSDRSFFETDSRYTKTKKSDNKVVQLRGPAAIIAAGRAMKKVTFILFICLNSNYRCLI